MDRQLPNEAAAFDLAEHSHHPGFLVRRFNQISISLFMERMAHLDITPLQYTIMRIVARHPGLTQKAIATRAVLDASTTHDIILRLEAKGFLTRARDTTDRRSRAVSLTAEGSAALRSAEPVVQATQLELVACLSPKQRESLMKMLSTLIESHLERHGLDGAPGPWRRHVRIPRGDL